MNIFTQNPDADLTFCRTTMFMDGTNRIKHQPWANAHATGNPWWDLLLDGVFHLGACLIRKETIPPGIRFPTGKTIAEDRDFLLSLLAHIYTRRNRKALGLAEPLHWYRQRSGSGARQIEIALRDEWPLMAVHLAWLATLTVTAFALAVLVLREQPTTTAFVGLAFVLAGLVLVVWIESRSAP